MGDPPAARGREAGSGASPAARGREAGSGASPAARGREAGSGASPAARGREAEQAAGVSSKAAAFFDLDKTLMAGSSGMQFARVATRHGVVGRAQLLRWAVDHFRYRLRGATDEETAQVLRAARDLITGVPSRRIDRMGPEVMAGILPRIYPQMLDEVNAHIDAGRPTFIVSAAGDGIVSALAVVLGMSGGIGTRYEVDGEGRFTGRLDGPFVYGKGKVEAMRAFAAAHDIDLALSCAYSDSASDLPMLRAVGNPVAVNPDARLAAVAAEEGWPVMRFERLGRKLAIAAAAAIAGLIGVGAAQVGGRGR
ncbi:MAG: HAD family hydrolase [Solirubrobacterales bacterium]